MLEKASTCKTRSKEQLLQRLLNGSLQAPTDPLGPSFAASAPASRHEPQRRSSREESHRVEPGAQDCAAEVPRLLSQIDIGQSIQDRKRGLQGLRRLLFAPDAGSSGPPSPRIALPELEDAFSQVSPALFKRFTDPVERVRELSVTLAIAFLANVRDLTEHLGYFFPALCFYLRPEEAYDPELQVFVHDIDQHEAFKRGRAVVRQDRTDALTASGRVVVLEASEELRALYVEALHTLLRSAGRHGAERILGPYLREMLLFLQAQLRDPCPAVKAKALEALKTCALSEVLFPGTKLYAIALARAVFPVLRHRHARVRVLAVEALHAIVMIKQEEKRKGAGTEAIEDLIGFRADNVLPVGAFYNSESGITVNHLAELCIDKNASVRRATAALLKDWVTALPDRYDHWSRLVPYVLTTCADVDDGAASIGLEAIRICGVEYEREHQDEVIERRQFGVDGDDRCNHARALPAPFADRPRLGARLFVRGLCMRFLRPLIRELLSWQDAGQVNSLRLLRIVLVYCEERLTAEMHWIVPGLAKAVRSIVNEAVEARTSTAKDKLALVLECCDILGRYMAPETYAVVLVPRLIGDVEVMGGGTTAMERAVLLLVFSTFCSGARPKTFVEQTLEHALKILHSNELMEAAAGALRSLSRGSAVARKDEPLRFSVPNASVYEAHPFPPEMMMNAGANLAWLLTVVVSRMRERGRDAITGQFLSKGRLQSLSVVYSLLSRAFLVLKGSLVDSVVENLMNAMETEEDLGREHLSYPLRMTEPVASLADLCNDGLQSVAELIQGESTVLCSVSSKRIQGENVVSPAALDALERYPRGVHWSALSPEHCVLLASFANGLDVLEHVDARVAYALIDLAAEVFEELSVQERDGLDEIVEIAHFNHSRGALVKLLELALARALELKLSSRGACAFVAAFEADAGVDLIERVLQPDKYWGADATSCRLTLLGYAVRLLEPRPKSEKDPAHDPADEPEQAQPSSDEAPDLMTSILTSLNSWIREMTLSKGAFPAAEFCLSKAGSVLRMLLQKMTTTMTTTTPTTTTLASTAAKAAVEATITIASSTLEASDDAVAFKALLCLEGLSDFDLQQGFETTSCVDAIDSLFRIITARPPQCFVLDQPTPSGDGLPRSLKDFVASVNASRGPGDIAEGILRRLGAMNAARLLEVAGQWRHKIRKHHPARQILLELIDHGELILRFQRSEESFHPCAGAVQAAQEV
eukprot:scaffold1102_cov256-Pinguiococcus_pyrenoidosus.AAC.43